MTQAPDRPPATAPSMPAGRRFAALDVFRGLTVFLMIVVNAPGGQAPRYAPLLHADWFGFTPTDLVYPSFLFAVGSALGFARLDDGPTGRFLLRVARRTAVIFAIGVLLYWFPFTGPFADTRIPGVLQRIALCYALTAIAGRWLGARGLLILAAVLLAAHWLILLVAGTPGAALSPTGNAGFLFDRWLFGTAHLYRWDRGYDPEGMLGTLTATVNVIAGLLATRAIRAGWSMPRLAAIGAVLIVAALAWSPWLPIGKKLWTGSFALLTIGIDLAVLAALVRPVERRPDAGWARFFLIFGRNPLALYLLSEMLALLPTLLPATTPHPYGWIADRVIAPVVPGAAGALLFAILYALVCWTFGWWLDRRGIIIKV